MTDLNQEFVPAHVLETATDQVMFYQTENTKLVYEKNKYVAALKLLRAYAGITYEFWYKDKNGKVGKRLLAMSGCLPEYDPDITAALKLIERR